MENRFEKCEMEVCCFSVSELVMACPEKSQESEDRGLFQNAYWRSKSQDLVMECRWRMYNKGNSQISTWEASKQQFSFMIPERLVEGAEGRNQEASLVC